MRRIFTELRQLIDHPMTLRPSNFCLAHYVLGFHGGSTRNGNVCCNDKISTGLLPPFRLREPEYNEQNSTSLVSDVSGLYLWVVIARPGVSTSLDNLTYKTISVIQKLY
ncbi:hypothetical protein T07_7782 [Trichinella nelsoni]|uniref:Uncharacterized protein n=1 Tax=Trichinella nelsoni TaxID=6336 RepID=A0A0V0RUL0_9BILA|nr:hypothetical protein T07_7782 [Trichinella nelsoni]